MLRTLLSFAINLSQDKIIDLKYPASIGPVNSTPNQFDWGPGLNQSVSAGVLELQRVIEEMDDVPVIVGYSLGALVITRYLEHRYHNGLFDQEIKKVILLANPAAQKKRSGSDVRAGICGPGMYSGKVPIIEISNWNDMICSTPTNSVLTKLPNLISMVTGDHVNANDLFWELVKNPGRMTMQDYYLIQGYLSRVEHERVYLTKAWRDRFVAAVRG